MDKATQARRLEEVRSDIRDFKSTMSAVMAELAKLQFRQNELATDIAELERYESWLSRKIGADDTDSLAAPATSLPSEATPTQGSPAHLNGPTDVSERIRHADVAEEILRSRGRPMKIAMILQKMVEMGHPLPAPDNVRFNTIYSAMKRRPLVFINLGDGHWGLVGRDVREADRVQQTIPMDDRPNYPTARQILASNIDASTN